MHVVSAWVMLALVFMVVLLCWNVGRQKGWWGPQARTGPDVQLIRVFFTQQLATWPNGQPKEIIYANRFVLPIGLTRENRQLFNHLVADGGGYWVNGRTFVICYHQPYNQQEQIYTDPDHQAAILRGARVILGGQFKLVSDGRFKRLKNKIDKPS